MLWSFQFNFLLRFFSGRDKRAIPLIVVGVVAAAVAITAVIVDCILTYNLQQEVKALAAAQKSMNDAFKEQQQFNEQTKNELLRQMKSKHDELLKYGVLCMISNVDFLITLLYDFIWLKCTVF